MTKNVPAVADLLNELAQMGATDLVVGSTANANLLAILNELGANHRTINLPDPEFSFSPTDDTLSNTIGIRDKRSAFAKKKHALNSRMRDGRHKLLRD